METNNKQLIENFYTAFSNGDANGMTNCYDSNVVFEDPAFGRLENGKPAKMWEMLMSKKKTDTKISFSNIEASTNEGKANWIAEYKYGEKNREVINKVNANFKFKDGKIIEHIDTFNLWTWTKQAMGPVGYLLGWTPLIKNKILKTTNKNLDEFIENNKS